jgi:hypothetical protein
VKKDFGFEPDFEKGKHFLEENDGAVPAQESSLIVR